MDFFEHQQRSRRRSRWLVLLFVLAVAATAAGVAIVVALLVQTVGQGGTALATPDASWFQANRDLLLGSAAGTVVFIALASWARLVQLRAGGGQVAESLGGIRIQPGDPDPARRRLYNVVEEVAIASGLPVPAVFVLERENGINAFAAGRTPADAAIAVTRGALVHLSRDELQGVVGHEFSHILHGDMTLNLRLMGYLFGILVVNMVGRAMVRVGGRRSASRSRGRGQAVIMLAGVGLYALGYMGVLVGRIIQAAVCRQREFLADASSVQFTRQTDGLAEALRKIAALNSHSYVRAPRAEEVSHMLFATGRRALAGLFATHPPIEQRLRALQPYRKDIQVETSPVSGSATPPGAVAGFAPAPSAPIAASRLTDSVGEPGDLQLEFAEALPAAMPRQVWEAAHRPDGATPLLLAQLLDSDPKIQSHQLSLIEVRFGAPTARAAESLAPGLSRIDDDGRLALMDAVFPAIRSLRPSQRAYLVDTLERLAEIDGRWAPFEVALVELVRSRILDLSPRRRPRQAPDQIAGAAVELIARMARAGHRDPDEADSAFREGLKAAGLAVEPGQAVSEKPMGGTLARQLQMLDTLPPLEKRRLVSGLAAAAASDGHLAGRELSLLRAACGALHCPLPPLPGRA